MTTRRRALGGGSCRGAAARPRAPGSVAVLLCLGLTVAACGGDASSEGPAVPELVVRETEVVIGRAARAESVALLTDANDLITIDPRRRRSDRQSVPHDQTDSLWGLAWSEGVLWTLANRTRVRRVGGKRGLVDERSLTGPALGLFGWRGRVILQPAMRQVGTVALEWSATGRDPQPFGGLQLRAYGTTRAEMLAFNLVMCGLSHGTRLPCWFRDEKRVDQVRVDGTSQWLELPSLVSPPRGASEPLEDSHRAVHDAYVSADEDLWILGWTRGASQAAHSSLRRLIRFDEQGTQTGDYLLPRPARLLLGVYGERLYFLGADGRIDAQRL